MFAYNRLLIHCYSVRRRTKFFGNFVDLSFGHGYNVISEKSGSHKMVCRNGEAIRRSSFGVLWSFMRGCAATTDWIACLGERKCTKRLCMYGAEPFLLLGDIGMRCHGTVI